MAEIRVEPKRRSLAWLWILLALAVVALVAWYLTSQGGVTVRSSTAAGAPALGPAAHAAAGALAAPGARPATVG